MSSIKSLLKNRKIKTVVFSALTLLYFAGLIAMFMGMPGPGFVMWAAAFIPSLAVFLIQKQIEQEEAIDEIRYKALNTEKEEKEEEN